MAVGSSNDFDFSIRCSVRAPAGTPRRSVPAQLGLKVALRANEDKIGGDMPPSRLHPDQGAAGAGSPSTRYSGSATRRSFWLDPILVSP